MNTYSQNFNTSLPYIGQPELVQRSYVNGTGSAIIIPACRIMGVVLSTNKIKEQASSSTDGSEMPRFLNYQEVTVPANTTMNIWVVEKALVKTGSLVFASGDTLATVVRTTSTGGGTIGDLLRQNSQIIFQSTDQLSGYDNALS